MGGDAAIDRVWTVPNVLSFARLGLSVAFFVFLERGDFTAACVAFVVAASTDWIDGWYARRYAQVSRLGRILDPFADKVIVCAAFIYLLAPMLHAGVRGGLRPWMVVVIVGRELLVTALRSFFEERGSDFSAKFSGKLKMLLQCVAAAAGLGGGGSVTGGRSSSSLASGGGAESASLRSTGGRGIHGSSSPSR